MDYHNKRKKPWRDFENYLNKLKEKTFKKTGTIIDLGCANGRHFPTFKNPHNRLIGIDNSLQLLYFAKEKLINKTFTNTEKNNIQLLLADMSHLPIRESEKINGIFSVAAIHHIKTQKSRDLLMNQIFNSLKIGAFFVLTLWCRWQKRFQIYFLKDWIKRKISGKYRNKQKENGLPEFGDIYVPWTLSKEKITINRYYHLFSLQEAKDLLSRKFSIKNIEKTGGPTEKDNIFIYAVKEKRK